MRVLIVDDERNTSAYVKRGLEEHGYAVHTAFTGCEALDWTEAVNFDLIVLNVVLPEMDGFAVCRELRKRGCQARILVLTARDAIEDRVRGLDAGADDYLIKPFAFQELLARLRALTRSAANPPVRTILQRAGLTLDTLTHRVKRDGNVIELTGKEYGVLECLLREADRVLSRAEIAEHVWNCSVYKRSNVVDVYIRHLRRKIDDPFRVKLIHTVRGTGYRLSTNSGDG